MSAMPVMIVVLCLMAIAYRFYSAFLAAKVVALDGSRETPAYRFDDGHNYHPTNKWVLFGHHFAAISGAGPLIGPVMAAQFGYLPGLLWIVSGVCLAGAVQDFIVLAASLRRGGRSLAQIAFSDVGRVAGIASTVAILFIIIIALAGLGKVVVKALGGENVKYPTGSVLFVPAAELASTVDDKGNYIYEVPAGSKLTPIANRGLFVTEFLSQYQNKPSSGDVSDGVSTSARVRPLTFTDAFKIKSKTRLVATHDAAYALPSMLRTQPITSDVYVAPTVQPTPDVTYSAAEFALPADALRLVPGSSWGTFTIFCTIPIALFVGLWMYKIRPGRVVEASMIGAVLTLGATVLGGFIPGSPLRPFFELKDTTVIAAMAIYGFIASVLPVWLLLCPRDYLSSFLKIGTIALLVGGVIIANPKFEAPAYNSIFAHGGPILGPSSKIFPFLFITIMCGAISGFHALVSSGTTPKMVKNERDARTIGYGAMLIEGLVGVCAMIAATTLPVGDYYAMNTDLAKIPAYHDQILQIPGGGIEHVGDYETLTQESLRGRTGGAVTLAVGMAHIFDGIPRKLGIGTETALRTMWKYWYHFAIMFEALFILTTIDTGTRIGRFLLQEVMGKTFKGNWGKPDHWPGAILSTALIVAGWVFFIINNSMDAIWPMFGVANQMLAVIALAVASAYLVNIGKVKYLWVTLIPMAFVFTTTSTGAVYQFLGGIDTVQTQLAKTTGTNWPILINSAVTSLLLLLMETCAIIVILSAAWRIWSNTQGFRILGERDLEPAFAGK